MKLLLLAENWVPRVGGIERYLSGLTEALSQQGAKIHVVVPNNHDRTASRRRLKAPALVRQLAKGRKIFRKKFFWPLIRPAWLPLFIHLWRRAKREKYDAILCGKALFEGHVGYYLKKYLDIPYVVFTYAMEIETWRKLPRQARALRRVLEAADKIVYINEVTKKGLLEAGARQEQLIKILPALKKGDLAEITAQKAGQLKTKYDLPAQYILSVGRLIPRKGFDTLLEAFAALDQTRFSEVQLLIAGDGPERENLENLAEKLWINRSVRFLGEVSDGDLPALYAQALVFAMAPREIEGDVEGFGIVYLEAAARGVASVGTKTGGVPEAVIPQQTGLLVECDNHGQLKDALTRLLSDQALRERLGRAARERVEREFLWEQRVIVFKAALKNILGLNYA